VAIPDGELMAAGSAVVGVRERLQVDVRNSNPTANNRITRVTGSLFIEYLRYLTSTKCH
jgi:hypothetical protein